MSSKLYDLMNWPDIEGVVYSECDDPYSLLGSHLCKQGLLIQAFRPDAVEMSVQVEGKKKSYIMEKVDEAGFFAVIIPVKKYVSYTLTIENVKGKKQTYTDPYYFGEQISLEDKKRFAAGVCDNAYEFLGSHADTVDGIDGVRFAVWAPNAKRVSVVGEFNGWDGRIFQMQKDHEFGIFELFIPGIEPGTPYAYEVKYKNGQIARKSDPYSKAVGYESGLMSLADVSVAYKWTDSKWYKNKPDSETLANQPLSICEIDLAMCSQENLVKDIAQAGFNYVKIMSVCATVDGTDKPQTTGYFAVNGTLKSGKELQKLINEFHANNIGVIIDWNAAYMGRVNSGLAYYDGSSLYEMGIVRIDSHADSELATFDYSKPQVCSFLYSSFNYWIKEYHVDGVLIDGVASMLYLDYGRYAGEWIPNMYGGNENGHAVSFLQGLRRKADKSDMKPMIIAEDESAWPMVTGSIDKDGLGFDYKLNSSWKKEIVSFLETDPLFRKGIYGKLTYSMLYQYSENFMLDLSHVSCLWKDTKLSDKISGNADDEQTMSDNKLRSLKTFLAYMYSHPGKKLINYKEIEDCKEYMAALNKLYMENKALYEQDGLSDGFEWVDDVSAEETVLSYKRRADDGTELMIAMNFTPVLRENFRIGVARPGKYKEVFNSESFMETATADVIYQSDMVYHNGKEESVEVKLPPLGAVVYSYTPYTEIELEEKKIIREAAIAKRKAEEEAKAADELKKMAQERAKAAKEAEEKARQAAEEAVKAQKEAEAKARQAAKASIKIEEEMKKKLEVLAKKKEQQ